MHIFVSRTYTQPDIYVKFCFTLSDTYELEGIICFFFSYIIIRKNNRRLPLRVSSTLHTDVYRTNGGIERSPKS